jgi:outer membrane protein assembly factor BamB
VTASPAPTLLAFQPAAQGPVATLDDSVMAREGLARVRELAGGGNFPEALRILQNLLDSDAEKVIETGADPSLHTTVRSRAHELLLASPDLLKRYREREGPKASELLDSGLLSNVETSRFLTPAGLTAAARLAQSRLDLGRFEAARLTLEQILSHPDRSSAGQAIATAARAATSLAALLPREDTTRLADSLRALAAAQNITIPQTSAAALPPGIDARTPLDPGPALDPSLVAPSPLRTMPLDNPTANDADEFAGFQRGVPRRDEAVVFPAISGNLLLVNDGTHVTALDKDTFSPRWSITPGDQMDIAPRADDPFLLYTSGRTIEDPMSVVSSNLARANVVVATTGIARNGRRSGDGRIHGIEQDSGRVLWSSEPQLLGPGLEGASIRGPAAIDADTVVLSVRRQGLGGRDTTAILLGLDLYTGHLRWSRTLGVVGRLPWQVAQRRSDALTIHRGIAYYADEIGVIAAVDASTGRPVWVRRMPTSGSFNTRTFGRGETLPPHEIHVPIVANDDLFVLEGGEPERQRIIRLDSRTGVLRDTRDATAFGSPHYLVRVGNSLAAVGSNRVAFVRLDEFAHGTIHATPILEAPATDAPKGENRNNPNSGSIIGHAIAAGDHLLVPLKGTVAIVEDPAKPDAIRLVPIEGSGNILLAGGSILAADLTNLRSFVRWEEASQLLKARIATTPSDIDAMLALVELSLRASRPQEAVEVAQHALDALDLADASGTTQGSLAGPASNRRRLFDTLFPILIQRPGQQPTIPPDVQNSLIASLDRAAEEPLERATFLISLGSLHAWRHDDAKAVEAFQTILSDDRLSQIEPLAIAATTPGRSAGNEATRQLIDLVTNRGFAVYVSFAEEAARAAATLPENASPEALVRLATRYPLAPASVELWHRAGRLLAQSGQPHAAIRALGRGLTMARTLDQAGRLDELEAVGRLGMDLVGALDAAGMSSSAYRVLSSLLQNDPMSIVIAGGSPSQLEELRDRLRERVQSGDGAPSLGSHVMVKPTAGLEPVAPQPLVNWRPAEVLLGQGDGSPTDCVAMVSPTTSEIGLFVLRAEFGDVAPAWTRPYQPFAPTVLRIDLDATFLFWPGSRGGTVEAIDNADGSTLWKTTEFAALFPGEPKRPVGERFPVPISGDVRASDLVVSMDDATLLLIERGGRVAAFDLGSGTMLWAAPIKLSRVFDVAGTGKMLLAGGVIDQGDHNQDPPAAIIAIEKRTGHPGPPIELTDGETAKLTPGEHVRWMRSDAHGRVVVSLATGLACIDAATGTTLWDQRHGSIKGPALAASVAGLVADDRILVLNGSQQLYMVPLATGETESGRLVTDPNKQSKLEFPIRLSRRGDRIILTGAKGMLVYDLKGALAGVDALDPDMILVTPLAARNVVVSITQMPIGGQQIPGRVVALRDDSFELYFLDASSARLIGREEILVVEEPSEVAALDGKLLIAAGGITFVLDVPEIAPPNH